MSNNLKIKAGHIISKTKLTKETKLQLLNFIQNEATDPQIKCLLMDGEIVQLDEQAEEIVNDRFKNHKLIQEGVLGSILGMAIFSPPVWAMYRMIRASLDKKKAQCGVLGVGLARKICIVKLTAEEATKMVGLLTKNMAECKNTKNPDKCIEQHKKKIETFKQKHLKAMQKLKDYQMKKPTKALQGMEKAKSDRTTVI